VSKYFASDIVCTILYYDIFVLDIELTRRRTFADRQGSGLGAATREGRETSSGHNRSGEAGMRGAGWNGNETRLLQKIHHHEQLRPSRWHRRLPRGAIISSSGEALLVILKNKIDLPRPRWTHLPSCFPFTYINKWIYLFIYLFIYDIDIFIFNTRRENGIVLRIR